MAISLKRNIQPTPKSSILPVEIQQQVEKSGTISSPAKVGIIKKIQNAVSSFFGGDINEKIQKTYSDLVSKGLDDNNATKFAIELQKGKGFILNKSIQSDYNKLTEEQKKIVTSSSYKTVAEQAKENVIASIAPESGIGKKVTKKVLPEIVEKLTTKIDDPVQKVITALKEAKPIRGQQEAIYTAERGAKITKGIAEAEKLGGQAGFIAKKTALKGELTKVKFEPLKIVQEDIDNLFNQVNKSQKITEWEKLPAGEGLTKLFSGRVPTENEIKILDRVFPKELTQELINKQSTLEKTINTAKSILNLPRSIMSSMDLSFGGRQGAFLGTRYRKEFANSWIKQFELFGSEKSYKALQETIRSNKYFNLAQESGLSITDISSGLSNMEEEFMSKFVDKIPIIRGSSRAYTGFANKFRMDVFSRLVSNAEKLGLDTSTNTKLVKDIAKFVNVGTGRGGLGKLERVATELNTAFFSPRLISSRLSLMNPMFYVNLNPYVRKEALKSLFTFATTEASILGLLGLGGATIGNDIRSSDFGKVKVGNTRIDISAGFQPYIRAAGQLITGKYVSSTTGKEYTLGEGYKPLTRLGIVGKQIESKLSPVASFAISLLKGQNATGEKINIPQEIADRFTPMVIGDVMELAKENPDLLPLEALGIFGVGVQTYKPTKKTTTKIKSGGASLKRK
jgi:hypothetical protein